MPEKKINNYRLSILNGKDQQKNEKDDYGDHFSTHYIKPPFLTFISSLRGNLFRLSFPPRLLAPLHRLSPLISQHGPKSLLPSGEPLRDVARLPSSTPSPDAWLPR